EDAWDRSWALRFIAYAMAEAGQFDRALQVAQKIEDARVRSEALRDIAYAMAKAGQFDLAVEVAETIDDPTARLLALAAIMAVKRSKGGQEAEAK
ncbi:MAG: hypothetical protein BKPUNTRY_001782, partial [Candidatus Fervidibacter sp.]